MVVANVDTDKSLHGLHYTSGNGFLLQQLYDDSVVVGK